MAFETLNRRGFVKKKKNTGALVTTTGSGFFEIAREGNRQCPQGHPVERVSTPTRFCNATFFLAVRTILFTEQRTLQKKNNLDQYSWTQYVHCFPASNWFVVRFSFFKNMCSVLKRKRLFFWQITNDPFNLENAQVSK